MPDPTPGQQPPGIQVIRLLQGRWVSQAITEAARLGIADLLAAAPMGVGELARQSGTHERSLYRLLRALASVGVFAEQDGRRFANTPLSDTLRAADPSSVRAAALLMNHDMMLDAWKHLDDCVKTGGSGFERAHGESLFAYLEKHPEAARIFDQAMSSYTESVTPAVCAAYDTTGIGTICDVGGGHGYLLAALLAHNPSMHGILLDLPRVVAGAPSTFERAGVAGRCAIVGGDFFETMPPGADAYALKHIIHDWGDDDSLRILRNIQRAALPGARLLVIEAVIAPGNAPHPGKLLDLTMMAVSPGGIERTEAEFAELYEAAGFRLTRVVPTASLASVIEGVRI